MPGVLQTGCVGNQPHTAHIFFDAGCAVLRPACLYLFVQCAQMPGCCETVSVCPVLPCGAPEAHKRVAFEVGRGFRGWLPVDVRPLAEAAPGGALGLALTLDAPACVAFSTAPGLAPMLSMAADSPSGCAVRVETQTWDIEFTGADASVQRRVDRMRQGTFFVSNDGDRDLAAVVETGFDGERWAPDTQKRVPPGETLALVAKYYGRFYRVTLTADGAGKVRVAFIGQYDAP
jgi:hypothetical protein